MPASRSVGKVGNRAERRGDVTASSLNLPSVASGATDAAGSTAICTSPRSSAVTAAGEPGNGRCTTLTPAFIASEAMARCDSEPRPIDP